jgi:hypothetical protein
LVIARTLPAIEVLCVELSREDPGKRWKEEVERDLQVLGVRRLKEWLTVKMEEY